MRVRPKLFAGVALDERVRSACAGVSARLQAQNFDAVYEAPEKLHLTMAFLGYVDAGQTPAILDAFQQCAAGIAPFSIDLDKLGAFPNERNPHVIWIGARDQTPFRNAALAVRAALEPLGFEFGKAPVAHVTIARARANGLHLPLLEVEPLRVHVRALTMFESLPDKRTTRYEIFSRAPLGLESPQ